MNTFRATLSDLVATIKAQNTRLDSLETRIDSLEEKVKESKTQDFQAMQDTILRLQLEIQERDQEALANDIEISNLPESTNENAIHILLTVAKKLGVDLDERDVVHVERAGPVHAHLEGKTSPRPRALVARLSRRALRDSLLRAARVRRGLTTEGITSIVD
ncbi:unnamed protein product, partial [Iphiclides podalirius]